MATTSGDKYTVMATEYLEEEIPRLAAWLEANVKNLRERDGEGATILITRTNTLDTGEGMWTYGNIAFDLLAGSEVL